MFGDDVSIIPYNFLLLIGITTTDNSTLIGAILGLVALVLLVILLILFILLCIKYSSRKQMRELQLNSLRYLHYIRVIHDHTHPILHIASYCCFNCIFIIVKKKTLKMKMIIVKVI